MSAPMEHTRNVRVRLILPNSAKVNSNIPESLWILIDFQQMHTIGDLVEYVKRKFSLDSEINFLMDGSLMPAWEKACILRDGDILSVTYQNRLDKKSPLNNKVDHVDTESRGRKRKFSELELTNEELDQQIKKDDHDDTENSPKRNKKEKHKHKHKKEKHKHKKKKHKDHSCEKDEKAKEISQDDETGMSNHNANTSGVTQKLKNEKVHVRSKVEHLTSDVESGSKSKSKSRKHDQTLPSKDENEKNNTSSVNSKIKESVIEFKLETQQKSPLKETVTEKPGSVNTAKEEIARNSEDKPKRSRRRRRKKKTGENDSSNMGTHQDTNGKTKNVSFGSFHPAMGCNTSTPTDTTWNKHTPHSSSRIVFDSDEETMVYSNNKKQAKKTEDKDANDHCLAMPTDVSKMHAEVTAKLVNNNSTVVVADSPTPEISLVTQAKANSIIEISTENESVNTSETGTVKKVMTLEPKKRKARNGPPLEGEALVTGAQVFSRQKNKKKAFYALSKEEQLQSVQTNKSIILEHVENESPAEKSQYNAVPPPAEEKPQATKDYSKCELLLGPPRAGDHIAYQMLEMGPSYTPEISQYKEAKVINYDAVAQMVTLAVLTSQQDKQWNGKFDLTVEDGEEILTNVASEDDKVVVPWNTLVSPRLVINCWQQN